MAGRAQQQPHVKDTGLACSTGWKKGQKRRTSPSCTLSAASRSGSCRQAGRLGWQGCCGAGIEGDVSEAGGGAQCSCPKHGGWLGGVGGQCQTPNAGNLVSCRPHPQHTCPGGASAALLVGSALQGCGRHDGAAAEAPSQAARFPALAACWCAYSPTTSVAVEGCALEPRNRSGRLLTASGSAAAHRVRPGHQGAAGLEDAASLSIHRRQVKPAGWHAR